MTRTGPFDATALRQHSLSSSTHGPESFPSRFRIVPEEFVLTVTFNTVA
jgi:hypothetical protein